MKNEEKRLSRYIDELNAGRIPKEHSRNTKDIQYDKMLDTVRRIRLLREPEYPEANYPLYLAAALKGELPLEKNKSEAKFLRYTVFTAAAAAAAVILFFAPRLLFKDGNTSIVYAMEQAFKDVKAYNGVIEVVETNELGQTMTQATREVWADERGNYYLKELGGNAKDIVTVNNGEMKWQLRPEEKTAYIFGAFPDPYRFTFELADEIEDVKAARTVREVGEETIAGRSTRILEVTPDGGETYRLWVDKETDLPLQKESAMQNAIQYKATYTSITFADEIPAELLQYQLPEGYTEINTNSEQIISALEEAESILGFRPTIAESISGDYTLEKIAVQKEQEAVKFYYFAGDHQKTVVIQQMKATQELKPDSAAILETVNNNTAEILVNSSANSIRWQEGGIEYSVFGNVTLEELASFAKGLTKGEVLIPSSKEGHGETAGGDEEGKKPEVAVTVDMEAEENEQKSVDAGHSPWRLDPAFVTQVFASLLISPEGIEGDYPIAYEDIEMLENDGTKAVARIDSEDTFAGYVYLERLVRQDETGIWTVVGYDGAK